MINKKINLFKNQVKRKTAVAGQDNQIQVISKKTLGIIKAKLGEHSSLISNDINAGPDDSCEISGIVNASDTQSS